MFVSQDDDVRTLEASHAVNSNGGADSILGATLWPGTILYCIIRLCLFGERIHVGYSFFDLCLLKISQCFAGKRLGSVIVVGARRGNWNTMRSFLISLFFFCCLWKLGWC